MRITEVAVFAVKGRHWPRFPMVFVEVRTDAGITGLGEALHYKTSGLIESVKQAGELLIGKDPLQIELHWETLYRLGINTAAISALETARSVRASCWTRALPFESSSPNTRRTSSCLISRARAACWR